MSTTAEIVRYSTQSCNDESEELTRMGRAILLEEAEGEIVLVCARHSTVHLHFAALRVEYCYGLRIITAMVYLSWRSPDWVLFKLR